MKMKVEATAIERFEDSVKIGVEIFDNFVNKNLIWEFYLAMLKGMRDAHEHEFHEAMVVFVEEEIGEME